MGYALLKILRTTAALASRFASISALPYTFIVVEIWACRMSFCCLMRGGEPSCARSNQRDLRYAVLRDTKVRDE
jgi:hypothetical protein